MVAEDQVQAEAVLEEAAQRRYHKRVALDDALQRSQGDRLRAREGVGVGDQLGPQEVHRVAEQHKPPSPALLCGPSQQVGDEGVEKRIVVEALDAFLRARAEVEIAQDDQIQGIVGFVPAVSGLAHESPAAVVKPDGAVPTRDTYPPNCVGTRPRHRPARRGS